MKHASVYITVFISILIFIFLYAAIRKVDSSFQFAGYLRQSYLLQKHEAFLVWLVPCAELLIVALLLFTRTQRTGLYTASLLLLIYSLYIGWELLYAKQDSANYWVLFQQFSWQQQLFFNIVLFAVTLIVLLVAPKGDSRKRAPP